MNEETKAAIGLRNQRESPLLLLPGELRNKVYAYVLGGRIFKLAPSESGVQNTTKYQNAHALLRTWRQLYMETHDLPLKLNVIFCSHASQVVDWDVADYGKKVKHMQIVSSIAPDSIIYDIGSVYFLTLYGFPDKAIWSAVEDPIQIALGVHKLTSLESIHIVLPIRYGHSNNPSRIESEVKFREHQQYYSTKIISAIATVEDKYKDKKQKIEFTVKEQR